ncbi:MAG: two-component system, OmpR family, sensor kinase, partial [Pseudonocardiales bacterium]|nr:two-component system, OmpR family, sensor kinase [Pseudonocardiales bacterium]
RRWRLVPRSLTARLVTGVVSLVVVLVLATGTATYFALQSFLYKRLDQQLTAAASLPSINSLLTPRPNFTDEFQTPQRVWVTVLDPTGQPTSYQPTGPAVSALQATASTREALLGGTSHPVSVTTLDGQHLRLMSVAKLTLTTVDDSTGLRSRQQVTVLVGLSTSEVDRTLHRLLLLEYAIGAGAIALAFAATAYGVRFSLRPLRRVTSTAREVTAELSPEGAGLDRRVAVTESDTEVGQLAESMNTLLGAVETQFAARLANEQRMRQFLADASHELRTPLTSIRGYAELARMQRQQGTGADTNADSLERIESEGTRMSRLVDDLLTLARSDQGGEPKQEWVDIAELLGDAVSGTRAAYPTRRIDLSAPHGLHVIGDRDQLLRVMRNLITNAAVHTAPEGPIGVSATREGHWVVLRVSDAGPGLPQEEAAHVFERFWRADKARTRARGGSGLGLAIVASIVQAHGGGVRFDSSVERGSTVTVSLPIGAASGMA